MSTAVGQVALGIYGLLLIGGGILGYRKAGSRPSLIAGVTSGVLSLVALLLTAVLSSPRPGFLLGTVLAIVLSLMFLRRLGITRKFMPSGVLAVCSLAMVAVLVWTMTTP